MLDALIGIGGVLIGVLLSEYFRRKSRIELFSSITYQKKLDRYEELYSLLEDVREAARDIFENPNYSAEERKDVWSKIVLSIAKFTDENAIYLSDDISFHCVCMLIGAEDYYEIEDNEEKKMRMQGFYDALRDAKDMIKAALGITKIDNLITSLTGSKPASKYISALKEAREIYKPES